jgi:hypothetical protein
MGAGAVAREIMYERPKLYPKQEAAIFDPARISCIEASTKSGKAQPVYSHVLTAGGYRRIGDLEVGDELAAIDGSVQTVTGVYPQGKLDVFLVEFSDGMRTLCSRDHLWHIGPYPGGRVVELGLLMELDPDELQAVEVPVADHLAYSRFLGRCDARPESRRFSSIRRFCKSECVCISVSHPSRLYLTDSAIVTHNTVGCMAWLFEQAWLAPGGQNFWWVAPYYGQAAIAYKRMKAGIPNEVKYYNDHRMFLRLENQNEIWFKSAEKSDALYGDDVVAVVVDEASRVREESWWAVRSVVTATQGKIRIIGNVKGKLNWAYRLAQKAKAWQAGWDGEGTNEYAYHRITALDAVEANVFPMSEVEQAKQDLPEEVFRELYMAEASELGANPFGMEAIRNCTVAELSEDPPLVWGWDLARKRDWTVGVGLDQYGRVAGFHRFQSDWPITVKRILDATANKPALVDSTGVGDVVLQQLERDGGRNYEGFLFTQRSKQQLMEGLSLAIQRGEVYFPNGVIVDELEAFEYEHTRTGVKFEAPPGLHDDCVCALALARQALVTSKIAPAELW